MAPILETRALSLMRGDQTVLQAVEMQVQAGDIFMIIGPSGGGKSSLLRCFNRLEEPEPGTVLLDGEDIITLPVLELRRRVGMVFQQPTMFPGTVAENVAFGPQLHGETLTRDRVIELLEMVTLEPSLAAKDAHSLSGGQAQRVSIARALANDPQVLLLDEPTSALDPIATHAVEETLQRLRDRLGLTLVWVSHVVEQAQRVGSRLLLLDGGRVQVVDDVVRVFDAEHGNQQVLAFARGDEAGLRNGAGQSGAAAP